MTLPTIQPDAETLFRTVVGVLHEGVVLQAADGRPLEWNPSAERILGVDGHELQARGLTHPSWQYVDEDGRPLPPEAHPVVAALRSGEPQRDVVLGLANALGEQVWITVNVEPLTRAGDESPYAVVCSFADITDRREAEVALARWSDELARSNADLEQFAYVASHDLQEPLRVMVSYLQLLDRRYRGQLDERADKYINYAVDAGQRMQQLVNDLLAYSRAGRQEKDLVEADLEPVVEHALANLRALVQETGARIERDRMPTVVCDPTQIVQVFQNLVGNALKFRRPGVLPHVRIRGEHDERARAWTFSVEDNGIGIAPEHRERIFKVFQRLHGRGQYQGTGIGLALVRRIVERHGGRVWVAGGPDGGTVFRFTLPDQWPSAMLARGADAP